MKAISKLAALGVLTLGFLGCGEDNEKNGLKNADGTTAPAGRPAADSKRSSEDFKGGQSSDPTKDPEYQKNLQKK